MAIIVPGILIGIFQMITVKLISINIIYLMIDSSLKEIPVVIRKSILALFLPIIIILEYSVVFLLLPKQQQFQSFMHCFLV